MAAFSSWDTTTLLLCDTLIKTTLEHVKNSTLGTKGIIFLFSRFLKSEQNKLLCNSTPFSVIYVQTKSTHKSQMAGLKSAVKIEKA